MPQFSSSPNGCMHSLCHRLSSTLLLPLLADTHGPSISWGLQLWPRLHLHQRPFLTSLWWLCTKCVSLLLDSISCCHYLHSTGMPCHFSLPGRNHSLCSCSGLKVIVPAKLIWGLILQYNFLVGRRWIRAAFVRMLTLVPLSGSGLMETD